MGWISQSESRPCTIQLESLVKYGPRPKQGGIVGEEPERYAAWPNQPGESFGECIDDDGAVGTYRNPPLVLEQCSERLRPECAACFLTPPAGAKIHDTPPPPCQS